MNRKTICAILFSTLFAGCAVQNFRVELPIITANSELGITVADDRDDKRIEVSSIAAAAGSAIFPVEIIPSLSESLRSLLTNRLSGYDGVSVQITNLTLKTRMGFGTDDDMSCVINSTVSRHKDTAPRQVKTAAFGIKNGSPLVTTAFRTLLMACLTRHADDVAGEVQRGR